ncbi:DUF5050 domain-containing protein [Paenibacillus glacialis]|uniref:Copper amine oxidase-like N-terminal domain-containing protein n=1 Tax=Paenibacillus glacialis TaxID=494026 RepID=A0A162K357_9BACL|nr:DUF5050 domain-containing protein [Paenibacillus glacialis]OAB42376.1 hypothetical protein PGLA_11915 [Paenibacillus glacialis]
MKKWMLVLLSSFYLLGSATSFVNAAETPPITVTVNDHLITFDVKPIHDHGIVLVPLRFVVDELGGNITSLNNNELILSKGTTTITLNIGSKIVKKNQEQFTLTKAPILVDSRTLVPLRFLSEAFGASIKYSNNNVSIVTHESPILSPAIRGNSIGNLNNGGWYASYEDWIFFNNPLDQGTLYKEKLDGTDRHKINDDVFVDNLNMINEKLYYVSGNTIYKSDIDGTNREIVMELGLGGPHLMSVVGDWIYYTKGTSMFMPLYRIQTDGTSNQLLEKNEVSSIAVVDGKIYYTMYLSKLFIMDVDGSNKKKLLDGSFSNIVVKNNTLYFNYNKNIYTMGTDGTSLTKISDHNAQNINVSGDWLYYSNYSEYSKKLYRINLIDHTTQKLGDDKISNLHILDNKIFYANPFERKMKEITID